MSLRVYSAADSPQAVRSANGKIRSPRHSRTAREGAGVVAGWWPCERKQSNNGFNTIQTGCVGLLPSGVLDLF